VDFSVAVAGFMLDVLGLQELGLALLVELEVELVFVLDSAHVFF